MDRPKIYTVGDSHGWHTWLKIPNVSTNHVSSPVTMYSFGQAYGQTDELNPLIATIPLDGIVCFCLGEIDCRCYINKYQPWQDTIDKIVEDYARALDNCTVGRDPKFIWLYFVVPPIGGKVIESESYPFVGTLEERIAYARYFNKKLKELKYTFIDLYDKYSNKDGSMVYEYGDCHVHIEDPKHLIEWINNESLYTFTK